MIDLIMLAKPNWHDLICKKCTTDICSFVTPSLFSYHSNQDGHAKKQDRELTSWKYELMKGVSDVRLDWLTQRSLEESRNDT